MRRTTRLGIVTAVVAVVGVVSCDGGPGALFYAPNGWDDDHGTISQRERPVGGTADPSTNSQLPPDRLPDKQDNAKITGGGTGGATFVCAGIYECILTGRTQTCITTNGQRDCSPGQIVTVRVRIELEEKAGICFIGEAVLESNGTLRGDDEDEVGTWTRQGTGIYIQAGESSGLCVPSSGPVGLVGIDGQNANGTGGTSSSGGSDGQTGSGSSSSGQGNISIDPGTGQGGSSTSSSGGG